MNTLLSENVTMGELTGTFPKQIFEKKCEDTWFLNVQFLSRVFLMKEIIEENIQLRIDQKKL